MITSILWKKPPIPVFLLIAPYDPYTRRDQTPGRKLEVIHSDDGTRHECEILRILDICKIDAIEPAVLAFCSYSNKKAAHHVFVERLKARPEFQENQKEFTYHAKVIVLQLIEKEND